MEKGLFDVTNNVAYFIWDYTKNNNEINSLEIWSCAEDIACYFESNNIFNTKQICELKSLALDDVCYVMFMKNIAFRIYIYTLCNDEIYNWYVAEKLFNNSEWVDSLLKMAIIYKKNKSENDFINDIRSASIKNYYRFNQDKH